MSRVAQILNKTKISLIVIPLVVIAGIVGVVTSHNTAPKALVTKQASQTVAIDYRGENGQNALDLLKKYAAVQTKHYSFGDQVISIDGTPGTGPKYWSFYVNGKLSQAGAGSYMTKNSDKIEWKLQAL